MSETPLDSGNPYMTPVEPVVSPAVEVKADRPPRVWTVFAAYALAFVATISVQVLLSIVLVIWMVQQGISLQEAPNRFIELARTPEFFIGMALPSQIALLLTALLAAWLSPVPLGGRLGLQWPRARWTHIALWLAGAIVPFLLGLWGAILLAKIIPPDRGVEQLYQNMYWQIAIPFIVFISVMPGLSEEFLFRGYMQRRLIERWSAWVGILVTSLLFAAMHIMPHAVLFAFPLGIWLGLMAWRCDSVWPGVICHALINGMWNIWQIGLSLKVFSADAELPLLIVLGSVGVVAFALACWDLATFEPSDRETAAS